LSALAGAAATVAVLIIQPGWLNFIRHEQSDDENEPSKP
jgi:hypothetical protein